MTRLNAPAAAAAVLVLLTGCSDASTPTTAPAASASSASSASSVAPASSPATAAGEDAAALAARVVAAMDARKTAKVSMTAQSPAGTTTGSGATRFGESTDMAMRVVAGATTMNLVLLGTSVYVQSPSLPTKKWIKISAGATDPLSRALAPTLESISSNASIEAMLDSYQGIPVTKAGTSTLDGVPVAEYVYALDAAALTAGIPESLRAQAGTQFDGATGTTSMWVDDEGLVRKVLATVRLTSGTSQTTLRYTDWGAPVTIDAPSAADVVDAASLS
ncbi:hypothetical protein [Kineosporia sp. A_224]|uniref:hypothetical protein n=1 Tax=Kineosporia sp. A_224 TaxID=1962180 RepID=UPI000B4B6A93|nr:hypothetical protein [Kineosporia sp. A_224]